MYAAKNITVTVGERNLLEAVTLSLAPGCVTVLIGPNGAGKSTLLKAIAGDLRPSSGAIRLFERNLRSYTPAELARFRAVLPQSIALAFPFTVDEVARLGLPRSLTRAVADGLVARALEAVGLSAEVDRICPSLSGGEQQRVHLARVLVQLWSHNDDDRPRFLLLDEPTGGLDLAHQLIVIRLARAHAAAGGGVLAVMHDLNLAAMLADEIVALDRGRVVAHGTPSGVFNDRLMADVYGVEMRVGMPVADVFILPQTATESSRPPEA